LVDIFHEIEEDLRRDKLNRLWVRYGAAFLTVAVLAVAVTAGVVFWGQYRDSAAKHAADEFAAADKLVAAGDRDGALAAFAAISAQGGQGYPTLALFREAGLVLSKGDLQGGLAIYDRIASSGADERLKAIARLRAAYAVSDTETPDVLKNRVADFIGDGNPWRFQAREIQAYADFRAGRLKEAADAFAALAADTAAPDTLRERAARLSAFIQGGAILSPAPQPGAAAAPAAPIAPTPAAAP
jgi:hypothetical protein